MCLDNTIFWGIGIFGLDLANFSHDSSLIFSSLALVTYSHPKTNMKEILSANKGKSGVYRWNNVATGDVYIGSAVDLSRRLREYFSTRYLSKESLKNNSIIYKALLKYGYSSFTLDILEYTDKNSVVAKEQLYLNRQNPSYNICKKAGSSLGRVTREDTRLKLRQAWLVRNFKNKANGLSFSEFVLNTNENKIKRSEVKLAKLNAKLEKLSLEKETKRSLETRTKILASSPTAQSVLVTELETNTTTTYPSARKAAIALNVSNSTIMNKLNGKNTLPYKNRYLITRFEPK